MTDSAASAEVSAEVIVNPLSGEQITILADAQDTDGQRLVWELRLAPGGRVPAPHCHPAQEERFTVLDGQFRIRAGWGRARVLGPGETVVVPPGRVHRFANPGRVPVRVLVHSVPALRMGELLHTAAAMARAQHDAGRRLPAWRDLVLFMVEFDREVAAPYLPRTLMRPLLGALSRVAGRRGARKLIR